MRETVIHEALQQAVHEVLETMFFVRELDDDPTGDTASPPGLVTQLDFEGDPGGCLTLTLGGRAARAIAADFLGAEEEDLTERQVEEVACELANMICGSVLSRTESETRFRLSSPQVIPPDRLTFPPGDSALTVGLDRGALAVHLVLGTGSGGAATGEPSGPDACPVAAA